MAADVIAQRQGRPAFTWGSADILSHGDFRRYYIEALRAADASDIRPILEFARS
jgi:hypothetical protein